VLLLLGGEKSHDPTAACLLSTRVELHLRVESTLPKSRSFENFISLETTSYDFSSYKNSYYSTAPKMLLQKSPSSLTPPQPTIIIMLRKCLPKPFPISQKSSHFNKVHLEIFRKLVTKTSVLPERMKASPKGHTTTLAIKEYFSE